VLAVDQRRHGRVVLTRIAEHVLVGEAVEELEERLGKRILEALFDEGTEGRQAGAEPDGTTAAERPSRKAPSTP